MLLNAEDYRLAARRALPRFAFDFIDGGAGDESCLRRNASDLEAVTLMPRVLRDTNALDTGLEVFGSRWKQPFGVTPTGFNGLARPGADCLLAAAAAQAGVPFVASTPSNERLEAMRAAAPHGELWLQLYVTQQREVVEQMIRRATALEFKALVLTVDVPVSGRRERDLRQGFKIPLKPSLRMAWELASHPGWSLRQLRKGTPSFVNLVERSDAGTVETAQAQAALLSRSMDRSLVWAHIAWLRDHWKGPIVVKGILHPQDAELALSHGVDAITVSNHGGRQLDASPSSISALPAIVAAVAGRVPVFIDGGFRRGSDVLKALSLGATAVFFGRPLLYAIAADGLRGASHMLGLLAEDVERSMILAGWTSPSPQRS
jgi:(S)-mandelate dehydrogenase